MKTDYRGLSLEMSQEDTSEEVVITAEPQFQLGDDVFIDPQLERQIAHLLEAITRVGGEVCRLRAEVDGLLEQNHGLLTSFDRLREVISEKGYMNLDDFELACDVMQAASAESDMQFKKMQN
jgi:regulator of replication initiation timing